MRSDAIGDAGLNILWEEPTARAERFALPKGRLEKMGEVAVKIFATIVVLGGTGSYAATMQVVLNGQEKHLEQIGKDYLNKGNEPIPDVSATPIPLVQPAAVSTPECFVVFPSLSPDRLKVLMNENQKSFKQLVVCAHDPHKCPPPSTYDKPAANQNHSGNPCDWQ